MTQLGKYTLLEKIGEGAFGEVYKATDNLGRVVAVKLLKPGWSSDPETLLRFQREAQAAGNLFHNRIATILGFDEVDGRRFLILRYIDGMALDKRLKTSGPLPWREALAILQQIAEALDFAHARGFIHRDIKPANILLSPTEGAILTDFGLVKAAQSSGMTTTGVLMGTPNYIAPEVWKGEAVSPATDIYALACVFYEMLTGTALFQGESAPQVMYRHISEGPRFPTKWPQDVPPGIENILRTALEQKSQQRFPSAGKFSRALSDLENTPVPAPTRREIEPGKENDSAEPYQKKPAPGVHTKPRRLEQPPPAVIWSAVGLLGMAILFNIFTGARSENITQNVQMGLMVVKETYAANIFFNIGIGASLIALLACIGIFKGKNWARLLGMLIAGLFQIIGLVLLILNAMDTIYISANWLFLPILILAHFFFFAMASRKTNDFMDTHLESPDPSQWPVLISAAATGLGLIPALVHIFFPSTSSHRIVSWFITITSILGVILSAISIFFILIMGDVDFNAFLLVGLCYSIYLAYEWIRVYVFQNVDLPEPMEF